ncbi:MULTISPECIES: methyltransferase domain-containing protein [Rossellomorea]|uniref:class I SAM-dependent methyltransferase n=1 Tax=Rossellomorea TaxID=2837508 RepID=UPI001CCC9B13|nr:MULTISPECIES: methyltransferase domain-containing protein [Rossellomorea]MCA0148503.1 class I SAM-dependent methyltransferase [Rossellomorea vietnamensis]WGG47639.1 methyltransferase domain-containing protein [Rossellomorea sp. DA94]
MIEVETSLNNESVQEETYLTASYRVDKRQFSEKEYNKFVKLKGVRDWSTLTWKDVGRPYEVTSFAKEKKDWEKEKGKSLPVHTSWEMFNRSFHEWFVKDVPAETKESRSRIVRNALKLNIKESTEALGDHFRLHLWNYVHRIQDGVWDPRGKRALFSGLDVVKPKILFLGAAEGYEAMQLSALYPGSEIVMVDYDSFCRDIRYREFPETYPFLGPNPSTGGWKTYYKGDFKTTYIVSDIRDLSFGREFDIVLSVGLLEHFPDDYKSEVIEWHRKFLKPNGYMVLTTPRAQLKSKVYYEVMADVMNHTYRELMTIEQMGLYLYENGADILQHGYIKVHNGIIAKIR